MSDPEERMPGQPPEPSQMFDNDNVRPMPDDGRVAYNGVEVEVLDVSGELSLKVQLAGKRAETHDPKHTVMGGTYSRMDIFTDPDSGQGVGIASDYRGVVGWVGIHQLVDMDRWEKELGGSY